MFLFCFVIQKVQEKIKTEYIVFFRVLDNSGKMRLIFNIEIVIILIFGGGFLHY